MQRYLIFITVLAILGGVLAGGTFYAGNIDSNYCPAVQEVTIVVFLIAFVVIWALLFYIRARIDIALAAFHGSG